MSLAQALRRMLGIVGVQRHIQPVMVVGDPHVLYALGLLAPVAGT
ncbi:MAG TPA: hypothetical protein VF818_03485 [Ktedonobacterales bacterium]